MDQFTWDSIPAVAQEAIVVAAAKSLTQTFANSYSGESLESRVESETKRLVRARLRDIDTTVAEQLIRDAVLEPRDGTDEYGFRRNTDGRSIADSIKQAVDGQMKIRKADDYNRRREERTVAEAIVDEIVPKLVVEALTPHLDKFIPRVKEVAQQAAVNALRQEYARVTNIDPDDIPF